MTKETLHDRMPDHALAMESALAYSVYIVECADGTFYTGIATDIERRLLQHNGVKTGVKGKGARYTASRRPVTLVFKAPFATRSEALKEEARVKRLTRSEKQQMIADAAGARALRP